MRHFRNPRYAPESLERKLHPSGFALPVTAEFSPASASAPAPSASVPDLFPHSIAVSYASANHGNGPPTLPEPPKPDPDPTDPWGDPTCPQEPNDPS